MENLEGKSRKELQAICKTLGLKANGKNEGKLLVCFVGNNNNYYYITYI